jgi:hypothetical protein
MLAGAGDHHVAALLRQRQRRLPFEVEMLLPADLDPVLDDMRRGGDGGGRSPRAQMRGPSSNRLSAASASSMVRIAGFSA